MEFLLVLITVLSKESVYFETLSKVSALKYFQSKASAIFFKFDSFNLDTTYSHLYF
jgi:hypothetical protein